MTDLENAIYKIVKKIPIGKVVTYSDIAEKLGNKHLARVVGNVLHKNPNPFCLNENNDGKTPCHRVVNAKGQLAKNFGFGGIVTQRKLLELERVEISENNNINLKKYHYFF